MSQPVEETDPLLVPAKARRTVGAKRAGAVIVALGLGAMVALAGQTPSDGAVLQAASAVTSPARFAPHFFSSLGGTNSVTAARKVREAASNDFAAKQQASLEASDTASELEEAAAAAEAEAVTARDAAVTARVDALNARVDSARATEDAVSGRTAAAQDDAAAAAQPGGFPARAARAAQWVIVCARSSDRITIINNLMHPLVSLALRRKNSC